MNPRRKFIGVVRKIPICPHPWSESEILWGSPPLVQPVMISLMHKWLKPDAFKSKLVINPTTSTRLSRDIHRLLYGTGQTVEAFAKAVLSWRRKLKQESTEVKSSRQCSGREQNHFFLSPPPVKGNHRSLGMAPPATGTAAAAIPACENPDKKQISQTNQVGHHLLLLKAFLQQ